MSQLYFESDIETVKIHGYVFQKEIVKSLCNIENPVIGDITILNLDLYFITYGSKINIKNSIKNTNFNMLYKLYKRWNKNYIGDVYQISWEHFEEYYNNLNNNEIKDKRKNILVNL